MILTASQARAIHLAAQGLLVRPARAATKRDVLAAVERMRLLQIDSIHVVARSPYLVLFSRLGAYSPRWLEELLEEGELFECWAHAACLAPTADYLLLRGRALASSERWVMRHARRMRAEHGESMDRLLAEIRDGGARKSADFESADGGKRGGWWAWKDHKRWLEAWFALGELMVARRDRFQRVYDVPERVVGRVLAGWDGEPPPREVVLERLVLDAVRALGVAKARWIADYFRVGRRHDDAALETLVAGGGLVRVEVRGWDAPAYVHRDHRPLIAYAARGALRPTHTTVLSPFDPIVWDRERALSMFGFDYRIECYTLAAKRRYGYFVLPLLHRGRLAGRLDAKVHRREGLFEIKGLFLEPDEKPTDTLVREVARAVRECADWHGAPRVAVARSEPAALARRVERALVRS